MAKKNEPVPARERALFPILVARAENHWKEFNPKLVKELRREGKLQQRLEEAAEHYILAVRQMRASGMNPDQAREAAAELIYLPPERTDTRSSTRRRLLNKRREDRCRVQFDLFRPQ